MAEEKLIILKQHPAILRGVIERLFTFGELNKDLDGYDSHIGNFPCMFHANAGYKSAKMYTDDETNLQTIQCFKEGRSFTVYDYITRTTYHANRIEEPKNPYDYLLEHKDINSILEIIKLVEQGVLTFESKINEQNKIYLENLFKHSNYSVVDYIENWYFYE